MEFNNENIQEIADFLYGDGCGINYEDNGDQIVVNVVYEDAEFGSYFFKFVIYKAPFKITEHNKPLSRVKMKTIKKLIKI